MEFALVLRELSRRRLLLVVGVLIAAVAAVFSVYRIEGSTLKSRRLQYSSANTQVLVDSPSSFLGNLSQSFEPLDTRAAVYANFMASPAVLNVIGEKAGLSGEQIYAAGPVIANQPRVVKEPTALKRNVQIVGETNPYRLNFESQPNLPTINIYAQAPTTPQAVALANAAAAGLKLYVTHLETVDNTPRASRVTIRQLGSANGSVVDGGISKSLMAIVFVGVFALWCVLILVASRFRETWRASGELPGGRGGKGAPAEHGEGVDVEAATQAQGGHVHASGEPPGEVSERREDDRVAFPTPSAR
jgi:capsular polysaccharide biosynthesis protein